MNINLMVLYSAIGTSKRAKMKNKILIALMLAGSGFFLYQGFSLLFHPEEVKVTQEKD